MILIVYPVNKNFNTNKKFLMSSTKFKSLLCRDSESVLTGPKLPKTFHAKNSTTSSVISTGINIGLSSYTSRVEQGWGIFFYGSFSASTIAIVSSVRSVLLDDYSLGNTPPPPPLPPP